MPSRGVRLQLLSLIGAWPRMTSPWPHNSFSVAASEPKATLGVYEPPWRGALLANRIGLPAGLCDRGSLSHHDQRLAGGASATLSAVDLCRRAVPDNPQPPGSC